MGRLSRDRRMLLKGKERRTETNGRREKTNPEGRDATQFTTMHAFVWLRVGIGDDLCLKVWTRLTLPDVLTVFASVAPFLLCSRAFVSAFCHRLSPHHTPIPLDNCSSLYIRLTTCSSCLATARRSVSTSLRDSSTAFLLHVALEIPFAVQGLFSSRNLPFVDATNTTLVMVKMYASLSLASCVAAVMMYTLPGEFRESFESDGEQAHDRREGCVGHGRGAECHLVAAWQRNAVQDASVSIVLPAFSHLRE